MKDGIQKTFYPNGQPRSEATYVRDVRHGIHRVWHPNGQLDLETTYVNGVESGVVRRWHSNGQLFHEGAFVNGLSNGMIRQWHSNGVLASEKPVKDGAVEGIARQWNDRGILLGSYEIRDGCGVEKQWHPNGCLSGEIPYRDGKWHGRISTWTSGGDLFGEEFYISGKKVSKKKYQEACKIDATLPRYEASETKIKLPSTKYQQRKIPVSRKEREQHDEFIARFRGQPNQAEARQWLAGKENRNIGEMTPEASREVLEEGYRAGALKITAVDLQDETTDCLIVELPASGMKRKRVFEWNNELAQQSGFDPNDDWGQNELFVFFD